MSAERDRADFVALREAALVTLLDDEEGDADMSILQQALAASEWTRVDPERRLWALGHGAGEVATFDDVRDAMHLGWDQLDETMQAALGNSVLDWIRQRE